MVIEPMTHRWKPLHLQYYELGVCGDIPGNSWCIFHHPTMLGPPERVGWANAITTHRHMCRQREYNWNFLWIVTLQSDI